MTLTPEQLADWTICVDEMPPENTLVLTKIDDDKGVRNEQKICFHSRLWWPQDPHKEMVEFTGQTLDDCMAQVRAATRTEEENESQCRQMILLLTLSAILR